MDTPDKKYPRLVIRKITCHCGSPVCPKVDVLPWKVLHYQYADQLHPVMRFESRAYKDSLVYVIELTSKKKLQSNGAKFAISASEDGIEFVPMKSI